MQLAGVKAGDLVEADVRGRRFYAHVIAKSGAELVIRPLHSNVSERFLRARQVVGVWHATTATRARVTL